MNNQFATQFLREDTSEIDSVLASMLQQVGAEDETLIRMFTNAVKQGIITPEEAINIVKSTLGVNEDGGSAVGGGVTNGASFTSGAGEQMAVTKAFGKRKKYQEDAPMLAHGKANISTYTDDGFTKAPSAQEAGKKMKSIDVKMLWKEDQAPTWEMIEKYVQALAKKHNLGRDYIEYMKGALEQGLISKPEDLYASTSSYRVTLREDLSESRAYSQFKRETATRTKDQQMHEAVKTISNKLEEVSRLVEFAQQMRNELSEGDQALEYRRNTKKIFERINSKVVEIYTKTRELK